MCQLPDCCPDGKLSPCAPAVIAGKLPPGGRIVEIGSGNGVLLSYLAASGFQSVTGVELSPPPQGDGPAILAGRAEALPLPDACCDAAVMECVFSLCEPEPSVRELSRVLVPGGIAVIADLFSGSGGTVLHRSPMVRRVLPPDELCACFHRYFDLQSFEDHTAELRNLFLQTLFRGNARRFWDPSEMEELKKAKAGYGIWIWKKH